MYESERESIEAQYWEARDQVRQRLMGAIEERRRKLREEKEGGDIVTGESGLQFVPSVERIVLLRQHDRMSDLRSTEIGLRTNHLPNYPLCALSTNSS